MNGNCIRTFLGANSSRGFFSLYPSFSEQNRTIIIKGGPGSGKSGIMKRIGAEALRRGYFTEYCYCSSDAESLDGIRIPELGLCVVDGTTPHTAEPNFPGAKDEIFYTGQFWDGAKLTQSLSEIRDLSARIKQCFAHTYRYLASAGAVAEDLRTEWIARTDREKLRTFACDFIKRHCKRNCEEGTIHPRFLSSISPQGYITNKDTVYTMADRVYVLKDPCGIGSVFLGAVIETAYGYGHELYVCYDPLCPDVPVHVILPNEGIAFVTDNHFATFEPQNAYRIHLNRFLNADNGMIARRKTAEGLIHACIREALQTLKQEKEFHDDLEEYYVEAMDFRRLNAQTARLIKSIF